MMRDRDQVARLVAEILRLDGERPGTAAEIIAALARQRPQATRPQTNGAAIDPAALIG